MSLGGRSGGLLALVWSLSALTTQSFSLTPHLSRRSAAFSLTSGTCALDATGCLTSPNYPGNYPISENCQARVLTAGWVTGSPFATESGFDILTIGAALFSGAIGPSNYSVSANDVVSWLSDSSTADAGWRLCWSDVAPPATSAPTASPTTATQAFALESGPCNVYSETCVSAPNYPNGYGNNERCLIRVRTSGWVTATVWDIELNTDSLSIASASYLSYPGPTNVPVSTGDAVQWSTDGSNPVMYKGFLLCLSVMSPAPTTAPTVSSRTAAERDTLLDVAAGFLRNISGRWSADNYCTWPGVLCGAEVNGFSALGTLIITTTIYGEQRMSGTLSSSICKLSSLRSLQLFGQGLSGTIPSCIGKLTRFETLWLDQNRLSGTLPAFRDGSWKDLSVGVNALSGTIPSSLVNHLSLEVLWLSSNQLSGTLPSSIAVQGRTNTAGFYLLGSHMRLSGTIPAELGSETTLANIDLAHNEISGTSSPKFRNWKMLRVLSLYGNPKLDWDLKLTSSWGKLQNLLLQKCNIRGTLPATMLSNSTALVALLLDGNKLSGTVGAGLFNNTPSLGTLTLSRNRFSGTLPRAMFHRRLRALLATDTALSGTIPELDTWSSTANSSSSSPLQVVTGKCNVTANKSCVVSPFFPSSYNEALSPGGLGGSCEVLVTAAGFVTATQFQTRWTFDTLSVETTEQAGHLSFSGLAGPSSVAVAAGGTMSWNALPSGTINGEHWSVCWSESPTIELKTLSLTRNHLTGSTDALEPAVNLETVLLSSNYLSCDIPRMDGAERLATGDFVDPATSALRLVGATGATQTRFRDVYAWLPLTRYQNLANVFAGNPELTTAAAILTGGTAGHLLKGDEIRKGALRPFPGYSAFKQLLFTTLPSLLIIQLVVTKLLTWVHHERLGQYLRRVLVRPRSSLRAQVLSGCLTGLQVLAIAGVVLVVLNLTVPTTLYSVHQGCEDPLLRTTSAAIVFDELYQWVWVLVNCVFVAATSCLLQRLRCSEFSQRALVIQTYSHTLLCHALPQLRAIENWRRHMPEFKPPLRRRLLFWILHVPALALCSLPAFVFVLSRNVSLSSIPMAEPLLDSALFVAALKLVWSNLVVRKMAILLCNVKHGLRGTTALDPGLVIALHKTRVGTALTFEMVTMLVAPMLSVFILDESCLRYYLSFSPSLQSLLHTWSVAQQGADAYRPNFCSRRLISEFAYVWISIILLAALITPVRQLVLVHPKFQAIRARFGAPRDSFEETLFHASKLQNDLVRNLSLILTVAFFGGIVPLLMPIALLATWLQLCALDLVARHEAGVSWGQILASNVLVQIPLSRLQAYVRGGGATVTVLLFLDLEFGNGPVVFYALFWAAEIAFQEWLNSKSKGCLPSLRAKLRGLWLASDPAIRNERREAGYHERHSDAAERQSMIALSCQKNPVAGVRVGVGLPSEGSGVVIDASRGVTEQRAPAQVVFREEEAPLEESKEGEEATHHSQLNFTLAFLE